VILAISAAFEAGELIREFQESKVTFYQENIRVMNYLVSTDTANSII
jgi:hypothetical protein